MSRASVVPQRALSLTEELEKLEQAITLTLQEIDHNFSRAHRIVTSSILPIVEQYAEHSKSVWEGSKFWKQFFEASANVSLSGYEEMAVDGEEGDTGFSESQEHDSTYATQSQPGHSTLLADGHDTYNQGDELLLEDADISGSTPRGPQLQSTANIRPKFADYGSPYESVRRELKGGRTRAEEEEDMSQMPPMTPGKQSILPDMSMTPLSSPFEPTTNLPSASQTRKGADPLLHRVLDKNYRLQATPLTTKRTRATTTETSPSRPAWQGDSSPMSSPPSMAPQLRSEIFDSPVRKQLSRPTAPRTPGVSVQTPAKGKAQDYTSYADDKDEITWESDDDDDVYKELGMSPPKTIQFAVAPSRLLQTPAHEASKRIVEDLLMTAGAGQDTDVEDSPSMVRMQSNMDDSF